MSVYERGGYEALVSLAFSIADLVPKEVVEKWLKHLRNEFPTIAFKASTQSQKQHLVSGGCGLWDNLWVHMCLHACTCVYMRAHVFTCMHMCLHVSWGSCHGMCYGISPRRSFPLVLAPPLSWKPRRAWGQRSSSSC